MAFCFIRKESVSKAVRRLGRELLKDALECLKDCDQSEAIHGVRKDIKKVRAALKLVRENIRKKEYRKLSRLLRNVSKQLAPARDAFVIVETLKNLRRQFRGRFTAHGLRHIRLELQQDSDAKLERFSKKRTSKRVVRGLRRVGKELNRLDVKGKGWKALSRGVQAAYAYGRRAYQDACEDPSAENFHEWRKHAKDLQYQAALLRRIWPEQMDAMAGELKSVGEQLGDDHDLSRLQLATQELCMRRRHPAEIEILNGLIDERQRELRTAAFAIGTRFYSEKPSSFCKRLGNYWATWCGEKNGWPKPSEIA